jgi:hypothetical protein
VSLPFEIPTGCLVKTGGKGGARLFPLAVLRRQMPRRLSPRC